MVVRTCDIKFIYVNYSQSNAVNASYLTDFVQICLFTSLILKMCLLFPLEFTETERGLATKALHIAPKLNQHPLNLLSPLLQNCPSVKQIYYFWEIYPLVENKTKFCNQNQLYW